MAMARQRTRGRAGRRAWRNLATPTGTGLRREPGGLLGGSTGGLWGGAGGFVVGVVVMAAVLGLFERAKGNLPE